MKIWEKEAVGWLENSIKPFPQELNEIDWKLDLSPNTDRLAQHLSAFSNYDGGGFLVFGVENGKVIGVDNDQCTKIITALGNIARQNLIPPIVLDHAITEFQGKNLLFVKIDKAQDQPIHLRSGSVYDSYIRSAGQTRKMDKIEVANLISKSQGLRFEDGISETGLSAEAVLKKIDFTSYFDMIERPLPSGNEAILDVLCADKLARKNGDLFDITNLGAILLAKNMGNLKI